MAFIGDSLARNHMESLLCLLSTGTKNDTFESLENLLQPVSRVETPKAIQKDPEDRFTTWVFSEHNFTLMSLWSQFLVASTERVINGTATGTFDLHLDRIDPHWSEKLPSIDYAVFSDGHWFIRQNYLYEGGRLVGCIYCQAPNLTDVGPGWAIGKAFRAAFRAVNNNCRKISSLLVTFSPSHFENGTWDTGGGCNRTRPLGRDEVDRGGPDWDYRKIQVEEIEIARSAGEESGNSFGVVDVTGIMAVRADGHPDVHWENSWVKGYRDCAHWCLPGPIDVWNELMFELIKRQIRL
ncbi:hypothetical protein DH2020_009413 [Rehmannia glutinosa]|uniref:Trichome birefringence-like C-terminal domain-containing protein n=1 Tax=Rehmannia glutinosa TaxID=99300 RepID=A0ABR0X6T9_REHGL